jgi:hypothetical protein
MTQCLSTGECANEEAAAEIATPSRVGVVVIGSVGAVSVASLVGYVFYAKAKAAATALKAMKAASTIANTTTPATQANLMSPNNNAVNFDSHPLNSEHPNIDLENRI